MNRRAVAELAETLRALCAHTGRLTPANATPEALQRIGQDLARARGLLDVAERPTPTTRCREHPHGPVEPDTDDGCLLCALRRPRAPEPPDRPEPPVDVVLRTIADAGEREAVRRFGARAVTRAHAAAGRGTHAYQHAARAALRDPHTTNPGMEYP